MEKKKFGILVDTAAGNDPSVYQNSDVRLLPLHIIFEDGTDILDNDENLAKTNFYLRVKNGENVKTSQASPGELMLMYEDMLTQYEHIIHIPIPTNLSSMYQTSQMIAKDDDFINKVTVVKHSMAANGIKECALTLSSLLNDQKITTIDEILTFLTDYEKHCYLGIIPGDLKKLARGGRAVGIAQTILNIFKTKVLIRWEEQPKKESFGPTVAGLTKTVLHKLKKEYKHGNYKFIFVSTPLTDLKIMSSAEDMLKKSGITYTHELIPPLYTAHAGVNTIGFVIVKTK